MKRVDLLNQKDKLWREIEALKKQHFLEENCNKSIKVRLKAKELQKKYVFINNLLKANKQWFKQQKYRIVYLY